MSEKNQSRRFTIKSIKHSYIFMLPIAGQTAEPIGLKFFVDT